jgi:hypothetical protein
MVAVLGSTSTVVHVNIFIISVVGAVDRSELPGDARRFPPEAPTTAPPSRHAPCPPLRLCPHRRPADAGVPPPPSHGCGCRAPPLRRGLHHPLACRLRTDPSPQPSTTGTYYQILLFRAGPRVSPRPGRLHPGRYLSSSHLSSPPDLLQGMTMTLSGSPVRRK